MPAAPPLPRRLGSAPCARPEVDQRRRGMCSAGSADGGRNPTYVKPGQFLADASDVLGIAPARDLGRCKDTMVLFEADAEVAVETVLGS